MSGWLLESNLRLVNANIRGAASTACAAQRYFMRMKPHCRFLREPGKGGADEELHVVIQKPAETQSIPSYCMNTGRTARRKTQRSFLPTFRGICMRMDTRATTHCPENITVVGCWAHARRKIRRGRKQLAQSEANRFFRAHWAGNTAASFSLLKKNLRN